MKKRLFILILITSALIPLAAFGQSDPGKEMEEPLPYMSGGAKETAVFAGGCFWGVEAVFESLKGVEDVQSGYSGGPARLASYRMVGTGTTGHAESVIVEYDPSVISYEKLLDVFFLVAHDPTQFNYQGPDIGPQYRSAIFYNSESQKEKAEDYIEKLEREKVYGQPIATEVTELEAFYPAEEYHQDFMALNPDHPYIVYWDAPKLRHLEEMFPKLLKK
ncbi:peptide-methionine (S)-S-oxide reductase [Spirochaeta isovalerica]|uniref:Peptide methionine sulfoxide reductase MsrA n=1 Tax=Spirochaeta isovalerica TaxID=150 RepID=A0A841R941_9SPIO|nr:peptide-methionine (S)-S-oxide reductase MsrA [Spirochaeta isovalerica]MBB6480425.1 peptide-methionine (S)-S-oxide reductase [Spirochaeta isovalerica]